MADREGDRYATGRGEGDVMRLEKECKPHIPNAGEAAIIQRAGLEPFEFIVQYEDWQFLRLTKRKTGELVVIDKQRQMVAHSK